jgi:diaminohydroxyphosphoribosylaminopyrimidine deaminase/5-amino-6-(5-phosphoribosylamino)uracil reductase
MDSSMLIRAAELADSSAGLTAPHPNSACIIAASSPRLNVVSQSFLYAQGTDSAEVQACLAARDAARGATAYLNLEPGDCHGDDSAIFALKQVCIYAVRVYLCMCVYICRHVLYVPMCFCCLLFMYACVYALCVCTVSLGGVV